MGAFPAIVVTTIAVFRQLLFSFQETMVVRKRLCGAMFAVIIFQNITVFFVIIFTFEICKKL